jgi:hypothetical protein
MKLAREITKIMVTGRSLYRKNNFKFKGRNRNLNRNRNCWKKNWDLEPEPRQNGTVPQHCSEGCVPAVAAVWDALAALWGGLFTHLLGVHRDHLLQGASQL